MSDNAIFAALFFPSLAAVLIFAMKYLAVIMQAKARLAQDEAYSELATRAVTAQTETVTTLADIQSRLGVLERILKEVE